MGETRHIHHNVLVMLFVVGYVLVFGSVLKYAVNRWHVPGLTELVNYTLGGPVTNVTLTNQSGG